DFFFQAEDGIRDKLVTGVQTCALPIFALKANLEWSETALGTKEYHKGRWLIAIDQVAREHSISRADRSRDRYYSAPSARCFDRRSEERRVGKEIRSRWSRDH